jgi:hypothetical protein
MNDLSVTHNQQDSQSKKKISDFFGFDKNTFVSMIEVVNVAKYCGAECREDTQKIVDYLVKNGAKKCLATYVRTGRTERVLHGVYVKNSEFADFSTCYDCGRGIEFKEIGAEDNCCTRIRQTKIGVDIV